MDNKPQALKNTANKVKINIYVFRSNLRWPCEINPK